MKKFFNATSKRRYESRLSRNSGARGVGQSGVGKQAYQNAASSFHGIPDRANNDTNASERPFMFGSDTMQKIEQEQDHRRQQQQLQQRDNVVDVDGNKNNAPPEGGNRRDRLLTQMETYNMSLNRKDPSPFVPMPRVSRARGIDDDVNGGPWTERRPPGGGDNAGGNDGAPDREGPRGPSARGDEGAKKQPMQPLGGPGRRKRRPDDEEEDEGEGEWRPKNGDPVGGPEVGGKTKFRRNVPAYYKIFELNSRFFLSGLGIITLINIFFATVACITGVQSDPAIGSRQVQPHVHLAFLAIVLIILLLKYSAYLFYIRNLNRRMEIAHLLFFLVILITTGVYAHWLLIVLPKDFHDPYDISLPCISGLDKEGVKTTTTSQPTTQTTKTPNQQQNQEPREGPTMEGSTTIPHIWYLCALIDNTYHSGVACIVFSCLLLCGLIANVIHAFMGIQNDIDITS